MFRWAECEGQRAREGEINAPIARILFAYPHVFPQGRMAPASGGFGDGVAYTGGSFWEEEEGERFRGGTGYWGGRKRAPGSYSGIPPPNSEYDVPSLVRPSGCLKKKERCFGAELSAGSAIR